MRLHTTTLAIGGTLTIMAALPATPVHAAGEPLSLRVADPTLRAGDPVRLSGAVPGAPAGARMALEYRPRGASDYTVTATAPVAADGRWTLTDDLPRTGAVRMAFVEPGAPGPVWDGRRSLPRSITFAPVPALRITTRRLDVRVGSRAVVAGRAASGTSVRLQSRRAGRWRTLDVARARSGRFTLRARTARTGSTPVRVRAAGRTVRAGRLDVYRYAHTSWYGPGFFGNTTGCGSRLHPGTLGVAHKSLPCGTKVTFRRGSRSVTVRVIDRGPYVGGREYDLTAAAAQRIGFRGHGPVLATR